MNLKPTLWTVLLASMFSSAANAGFELIDDAPAPVQVNPYQAAPAPVANTAQAVKKVDVKSSQASPSKAAPAVVATGNQPRAAIALPTKSILMGGLVHEGRKPVIVQPARGFGKVVTLKFALSSIIPENFRVYNDGQVNMNANVSWSSKDAEDWPGVLDTLFKTSGINGTVNWDNQTISLNGQVKLPPPAKPVPTWTLKASERTVKAGITRWAKEAGWSVSWDVPVDFPIPYDVVYSGELVNAVNDVMASLKLTDYPVQACLYSENNSIRVVRFGDTDKCDIRD